MATNKPFHLLTPAERTARRIAENKAVAERAAERAKQEAAKRAVLREMSIVDALAVLAAGMPEDDRAELLRIARDAHRAVYGK